MINEIEIINAFKESAFSFGVTLPDHLIADGQLHRFKTTEDKAGKTSGAYKLNLDGKPAGYFEDFRLGIKERWKYQGKWADNQALPPQEIPQKKESALAATAQAQATAALKAQTEWDHATPAIDHPYLINKGIQPHHARQNAYQGIQQLIIPLQDETGAITSLQRIKPDGSKYLLKGGRKQGCYSILNPQPEPAIIGIGEGFATIASVIQEDSQIMGIMAIDAGNLESVAITTRKQHPNTDIFIFGDIGDDHSKGEICAQSAAKACNGFVVFPPMPKGDFNDYLTGEIPVSLADLMDQARNANHHQNENRPMMDEEMEECLALQEREITIKQGQMRNKVSADGFVSYVAQYSESGQEIEWDCRLRNLVKLMNEHHAVTTIGGKTRVMKIKTDETGRNEYEFFDTKELARLYSGRKLQTGWTQAREPKPVIKDYATAWLDNPYHRIYGDGVVFKPGQQLPASYFNMWQGFTVEPKQATNKSMVEALGHIYWHINEIICAGNPGLSRYFYDWVAYTFQHPDKPAGTALVCRGEKGVGKGLIAQFLLKIWGKHGFTISSSKHLVGNFNAHLADTCFLFADEAFFSGDKQGEGRLKALITEPLIPIERKGIDVVQQPNYLKIFMATNSDWAVPASRDERRYCVLDVSSQKRGDKTYFDALHADINSPEVQAAFLHDMLHRDISQYHSGKIPETQGLMDQRMHSLDSVGKWLVDSFTAGFFDHKNATGAWFDQINSAVLFDSYVLWCDRQKINEYGRKTQTALGLYLKKIGVEKKHTMDGDKRIFGSLDEAISRIEQYEMIKIK